MEYTAMKVAKYLMTHHEADFVKGIDTRLLVIILDNYSSEMCRLATNYILILY